MKMMRFRVLAQVRKALFVMCALAALVVWGDAEITILREAIVIPQGAWFDTGYVVKGHPRAFMRAYVHYQSNTEMFGMADNTQADYFAFRYSGSANSYYGYIRYGSDEVKLGSNSRFYGGTVEFACDNYLTKNGVATGGEGKTPVVADHDFSANTQTLCFPGRNQRDEKTVAYQTFRIDDSGVTKRDFVAAKKGDELGFYDRVEGKFYSMSGEGTLKTYTLSLVCTWTGKGADNNWSTAANWDYPPQGGEMLVFPTEAGSVTAHNDITGLVIASIRCGQNVNWENGIVHLTGNAVTATAATPWENYSEAVVDLPLVFDLKGEGDAASGTVTYQCRNSNTLNGELTLRGGVTLDLVGSRYNGTGAYNTVITNIFNGPITGPKATFNVNTANSHVGWDYFYGKMTLDTLRCIGDWSGAYAYIKVGGHEVKTLCARYQSNLYLNVPNAFPGAILNFDHTMSKYGASTTVRFWGGDETLDRITEGPATWQEGVDAAAKNSYDYSKCDQIMLQNKKVASIFRLLGTDNAYSCCWFGGYPISLSWEPTGDYTQEFCNRTHLNTGTISVSRGTFRVSGTNAFQNVTGLYVHRGANLDIATTPARAAFPAAGELLLGDAARCYVTNAAAVPFTANKLFLSLGTDAKIVLTEGARIDAAFVRVGSQSVAAGTYTSANATWIEGAGAVVVSGSWSRTDNVWLGGAWDEASSWSAGVPSATSDLTLTVFDTDATLSVAPSAQAKSITARGEGGTIALNVAAGAGDWGVTTLTLNAGSRMEVPAGAAVKVEGIRNFAIAGGELRVTGGEMIVTNYGGSFAVSGSGTSTGRVVLAAGVLGYSTKSNSSGYRLTVNAGGELVATGGVFRVPQQVSGAPATRTQGGFVQYGGDVRIESSISYPTDTGEWANGAKSITFRSGQVIFDDNAELNVTSHNGKNSENFYLYPDAAGEIIHVILRDHVKFTGLGYDGFVVGAKDTPKHLAGAKGILELDAEDGISVQLGYWTCVGMHANAGEMIVRQGAYKFGLRGFMIGGSPGGQYKKDIAAGGAEGLYRMYGGSVYIASDYTTVLNSEGIFAGFCVGEGALSQLPTDAKGCYTGRVELVDGVITNKNGGAVIGGARALGIYNQTGGCYYHKSVDKPLYIGLLGGDGMVTLGGGEMHICADTYIGGALTNVISGAPYGVKWYGASYPYDVHTATGLFTLTGGVFACEKQTMLGMDGTAILAVRGSRGTFTTKDLVISNTLHNTSISFTFDADGVTPLQASGTVENTAGTQIVVDLGDFNPKAHRKSRYPLITWDTFTGEPFTATVSGTAAKQAVLEANSKGLALVFPRTTTIIFR